MDSVIDFNAQNVLVDSLCVEDIGNCALEAVDERGGHYYIVVKTIRGWSYILEWGPTVPDINALPKSYGVSYSTMSYTDVKMQKHLKKWALAPKGTNFVEMYQISCEDAYKEFRNALDYYKTLSEDDEEEEE